MQPKKGRLGRILELLLQGRRQIKLLRVSILVSIYVRFMQEKQKKIIEPRKTRVLTSDKLHQRDKTDKRDKRNKCTKRRESNNSNQEIIKRDKRTKETTTKIDKRDKKTRKIRKIMENKTGKKAREYRAKEKETRIRNRD